MKLILDVCLHGCFCFFQQTFDELFAEIDVNGDGTVDQGEYGELLKQMLTALSSGLIGEEDIDE
jgi:hypothetical protein